MLLLYITTNWSCPIYNSVLYLSAAGYNIILYVVSVEMHLQSDYSLFSCVSPCHKASGWYVNYNYPDKAGQQARA